MKYGAREQVEAGLRPELVVETASDSDSGSTTKTFISDDFSSELRTDTLWTFYDPVGDGAYSLTGTQLELVVPEGTEHDVWTEGNDAVRMMQTVPDTDFEVEVKFESIPTLEFQMEGLLVEEGPADLIRFDVHSGGDGSWEVLAASFDAGSPSVRVQSPIDLSSAMSVWLRVGRSGDQWTLSVSTDGSSFEQVGQFTHAIQVGSVGVFAGNAGASPPAFTAVVDYAFETSSPIDPEDGDADPVAEAPPVIEVWHGHQQRVGHVGHAQLYFNLLGNVSDPDGVDALTYRVNDGTENALTVESDRTGWGDNRRLERIGDFNADIPLNQLSPGTNTVTLTATDGTGRDTTVAVTVDREEGGYPLPAEIDWNEVVDPQDAGQYVDGQWARTDAAGLRIQQTGYDRMFLVGDTTWQDYEVRVPVRIHAVDPLDSGIDGLGLLVRFRGHRTGGVWNWPDTQPSWGYLPFGGLGWLRWIDGPDATPHLQFHPGDSETATTFDPYSLPSDSTVVMKIRSETLPDSLGDDGTVFGITRYSYKI